MKSFFSKSDITLETNIFITKIKTLTINEINNLCKDYGLEFIEDSEETNIIFEELYPVFSNNNCLEQFYETMKLLVKYTITKALDEHQKEINIKDLYNNIIDICGTLDFISKDEIYKVQKNMINRFNNLEQDNMKQKK